MPELPEVEFCGRALERWTRQTIIEAVEVTDGRSVRASRTARPSAGMPQGERRLREIMVGKQPEAPIRHGKRLYWGFGGDGLLLHLGMTGKWTRRPTQFPKVRIRTRTSEITFSDPRLLGGIVPCTRAEGMRMLHEGLGPDALRDPLPVLHGKRAVKLVLMDQSVVAGVGNLHAAEALWRAGLSPLLPASSLAARQHRELDLALKAQLSGEIAAFEQEDEITYVEDAGANNPFPVYGQEGKRCPRCTATIERFTQGGRSTYWCPRCQK